MSQMIKKLSENGKNFVLVLFQGSEFYFVFQKKKKEKKKKNYIKMKNPVAAFLFCLVYFTPFRIDRVKLKYMRVVASTSVWRPIQTPTTMRRAARQCDWRKN